MEIGVVDVGVDCLEFDVVGAIDGTVDTGAVTVALGAVDDGEGDIEFGAEVVLQPTANKILKNKRAIKINVCFTAFSPY